MASPSGKYSSPVARRLIARPRSFGFVQAVRVLEACVDPATVATAKARKESRNQWAVGRDAVPSREAVRFKARAGLSFPSRPVTRLREHDEGPVEMDVAAFGLTGPCGPMPGHYTEKLLQSASQHEPAPAALLDLFHHRALSFLYRASIKYRPALSRERSARVTGIADPIETALAGLVGRGEQWSARAGQAPAALADRDRWIYYGGQVGRVVPTTAGLTEMLREMIAAPIRIEPFRGTWLPLDDKQRTRLVRRPPGRAARSESSPRRETSPGHNILGDGAMLGRKTLDLESSFTVHVGPLSYPAYLALLPGEPQRVQIDRYLARVLRAGMEAHLELELAVAERPVLRLGGRVEDPGERTLRPSLGRNTWLPRADRTGTGPAAAEGRPRETPSCDPVPIAS